MSARTTFSCRLDLNGPARYSWTLALVALISCLGSQPAMAQSTASQPSGSAVAPTPPMEPPIMDNTIFKHILFDQLEGRTNGSDNALRWDGQGWIGTDMNRLWLKSEGFLDSGTVTDGDIEALYDRPIPHMRYFDAQVGIREDLDSGPRRTWGAIGIEGLAPYFFEIEPTFYFRDGGHVAGRLTTTYDLLITQRLIVQPELEMNFYSKRDPQRLIGAGLSDLDVGVRLRYEIRRKFAPYIGFAYTRKYGDTGRLSRQAGETLSDPRLVFGFRVWY
jgi:copper resistance protein B